MKVEQLKLGVLRTDGGTQMRAELSQDVYMDYRERMLAGASFPPIDVFFDGSTYWLADGFHRFYGAREAKLSSIEANVHNGTLRDAIIFAVGANGKHGLKRTNRDKRIAVERLLNDEEWATWSDRKIADAAGVAQPFVSSVRKELITVISSPAAAAESKPRVGKDGKARKPPAKKSKPARPVETVCAPEHAPESQDAPPDGPCPKGGEHDFDDEACRKCLEPVASEYTGKPSGGTTFNPAEFDKDYKPPKNGAAKPSWSDKSIEDEYRAIVKAIDAWRDRILSLYADRVEVVGGRGSAAQAKANWACERCHDAVNEALVAFNAWRKA